MIDKGVNKKISFMCSGIIGVVLSTLLVVGGKIDRGIWEFREGTYVDIVRFFIYAGVISIAIYFLFMLLDSQKKVLLEDKYSIKRGLIKSLIIFLCWLPYLLVFYPGNLSVDSYASIQQVLGNMELSNAHPILYTAIVGVFVKTGMAIKDLEFGIALYSIFQMMVISVVFGGIAEFLRKKSSKKCWEISVTLFFALNPLIAMYSMTMWKDIFFSTWLLLLVVYLYKILGEKKEEICKVKTRMLLAIFGILVSFGRNNGIYIVCLVYFMLLIYYLKFWKKIILWFAMVITFIMFVQGPVYSWIGIQKGNLAESLAVPLQQIAYTVKHDGEITKEQEEFLGEIIPLERMKEVYIPYSSNGVKFDPEFDNKFLEENLGEFLKTWAEILPKNFSSYVKAYLIHTLGYWHVGTNDWRCIYGVVDSPGIQHTNFLKEIGGVDFTSQIKSIVESKINTIPIVNLLYSIAFSVWIVFFSCICLWKYKKNQYIISLLPLIGNWITIMIASPIYCEFRYMFSFHIALPVVFFITCNVNKKTCEENLTII